MKRHLQSPAGFLTMWIGVLLVSIQNSWGAPVTGPLVVSPGNLLIGVGRDFREYTPDGQFVKSLASNSHPIFRPEYFDSVYDSSGRIHVLSTDHLATLSSDGLSWTYTPYVSTSIYASASDLSLLGDQAWTSTNRFDLTLLTSSNITLPGGEWSEVEAGPDGLIYAINGGNPRYRMRAVDPADLSLVRTIELRDGNNARLTVGSLAFLDDGSFYAASENRVHRFTGSGQYLDGITLGSAWVYDLELLADGSLVAGTRSGELFFIDAALDSFRRISIGGSGVYIGVVPTPDTTPPVIRQASADQAELWPPNRKLVPISLLIDAEDDSGEFQWGVASVTCSETPGQSDIVLTEDDDGFQSLFLRATRGGRSDGRTYTIDLVAWDEAGNRSEPFSVRVVVPHDQRKGAR